MDRRSKALLLVAAVGLIGVAGGIEWYSAPETAVYEDGDEIVFAVEDERVTSLGSTDTRALATAAEDGANVAAVHVPNSSVSSTSLVVVWQLPDGFWYDTQLEIEPVETQAASFSEPTTTSYAANRFPGGEPDITAIVSRNRLEYPIGSKHGRIDTLSHATESARNETVMYEVRLTSRSLTGASIDVATSFEIEYAEFDS